MEQRMKRILVIEDNDAMREEIVAMLGFEGFEVMDAEDGRVGLQVLEQQKPDLILCDIMMPNLDGYGTLEAVRGHPETSSVPFVFLTAKASDADRARGVALGASAYMVKPFNARVILDTINGLLGDEQATA
jgi:CheY-like chemotaxis protein